MRVGWVETDEGSSACSLIRGGVASGVGGVRRAHGEAQPIPWPVRMAEWCVVLGGGVHTLSGVCGAG